MEKKNGDITIIGEIAEEEKKVSIQENKAEVIGFIGDDFYEAVLLLALTKRNLEYSVLLLDYSEEKKLVQCLPVPAGQDVEYDLLNYKGIDYTAKKMNSDELNYNCIFVYYGYKKPVMKCDQWFIVSNQELLVQKKILNLISENSLSGKVTFILHDVVTNMNNELFFISLSEKVNITDFVELEIDYRYFEQRVKCQRGKLLFRRIPNQLSKLLLSILYQNEEDKKKVKRAFIKSKGGSVIDNSLLEYTSWTSQGNV